MVDIEKALNPFHLVTCFLGCGIFRHSLGHARLCFSIFYILTVWSVYALAFYCIVIFFASNRTYTGFLITFMIMTNLLVTTINVIIPVREHEKFYTCIRNLSLIDDTLEQLGTPKEYLKMRKSVKWILTAWFMMICITWTSDACFCIAQFQDTRAIIIPLVVNYPIYLNTFMDIMFIFYLRYIGTRFDRINDYIEQLSDFKECGFRYTWKKSLITRHHIRNAETRKHVLWIAMHLHLKLCRIARDINNFFGMQMTLQMISYFVLFTAVIYLQYYTMSCLEQIYRDNVEFKLASVIQGNIWCGICLTKLITLNYICDNVGAKAKKTKEMIHILTNFIHFDQIREDICQFVLQISLQPLKFNGMGLIYFGFKFLFKFIAGIVSVIIFMVQMDNSPLSRILISGRYNTTC